MNWVREWAEAVFCAAVMASPVGLEEDILEDSRESMARWVRSAVVSAFSSEGRATSVEVGTHPRRSECLAYTFLLVLVPPVTMAS